MNTDSHAEQFVSLNAHRLKQAKAAHTTRRVRREAMVSLLSGEVTPHPGDVLLARVEKLGKHKQLELCDGRRSGLFIGDEIVVAYGNRYAPDQFEAVVPEDLSPCHLVAGGGVAALALSWHEAIPGPTSMTPLGLIADGRGVRLNLKDTALGLAPEPRPRPFTVAVAGTAMNAGKTATATQLIYGAVRAGMRVAAAKVTGTGSGGDTWLMRDAGADPVLDFTDLGFVSIYRVAPAHVENIMRTLVQHLAVSGADLIVIEIADGLYQEETAALLSSRVFARHVDAMLFAANDAMGAAAGVRWLREHRLPVVGVAGTLTRSPLALREAGYATGLPVYRLSQLCDPMLICDRLMPAPEVSGQAA